MSHNRVLNEPIMSMIPYNCGRVLDVACGKGDWGFQIRTRKNCSYLVGIDIWKPFLDTLSELNVYDELIEMALPELPRFDEPFDVILASEILEHLTKKNGHKLLINLEQVVRTTGRIITSTPIGYPEEATPGYPYAHISEWTPTELENLGYKVHQIHTLPKAIRLVDGIRRFLLRSPKSPIFLIAVKQFQVANLRVA